MQNAYIPTELSSSLPIWRSNTMVGVLLSLSITFQYQSYCIISISCIAWMRSRNNKDTFLSGTCSCLIHPQPYMHQTLNSGKQPLGYILWPGPYLEDFGAGYLPLTEKSVFFPNFIKFFPSYSNFFEFWQLKPSSIYK